MVVNRDKAPSAQETFVQMAQAAGLRGRLLVTVGLLILVRLGIYLPIPGIDRVAFQSALQDSGLGSLVSFLDVLAGGGISALGIFALGILPYINASIIIQLMTAAIPQLEDLQKNEGEAGRRKISQITRFVALGWAILNSVMITTLLVNLKALSPEFASIAQTVIALTAGSMFVMWISEVITERGIGNGASLLIFVSIVSTLPKSLGQTLELAQSGDSSIVGRVIILLVVFLVMIVSIVFVQEGTRRIPIISARRQVGKRTYQEKSSYLPLRLNQGGVMPIIFASAMLSLPFALGQAFSNNQTIASVISYIQPGTWLYPLLQMVLIVFFSYFYSSLIVNPVDMSQNLKKMGASIPGIRPGKATSEYIGRVLNRLTFLGAGFLGLVAILPTAVEGATQVRTFQGLGATSILILVGVAIDTAKQIQTYVISQRYEGDGETVTRLIFLGPPGAGKGTQAQELAKTHAIPHISTGDILRVAVSEKTDLGRKAGAYMDAGDLVPDSLILEMVRDRLTQPDTAAGWLLDGFPRTVTQATFLDQLLQEIGQSCDSVINFDVPDEMLVQRLLERGRKDDNEEVILNRLGVYRKQTEPLIDFYQKRQMLITIDGSQPIEGVTTALASAIQ